MRNSAQRVHFGSLCVDAFDKEQTLTRIGELLDHGGFHRIATCNLNFLRLARKHQEFRKALQSAALVTADGAPLVWLSRFCRTALPARVTGVGLIPGLLRLAHERRERVFFLGGSRNDALDLARQSKKRYPGLHIAGVNTDWLNLDDQPRVEALVRQVASTRPGIVIVGFDALKQQLFLSRHGARLGARIGIGVGGSFAILSGQLSRAPRWVQRCGAEWLWRLAQEPQRLGVRYARDLLALPAVVRDLHRAQKQSNTPERTTREESESIVTFEDPHRSLAKSKDGVRSDAATGNTTSR